MTDGEPAVCAQCGEPIPEWYLKISAGIWCQNCDDNP
jgi:hypothetical protein